MPAASGNRVFKTAVRSRSAPLTVDEEKTRLGRDGAIPVVAAFAMKFTVILLFSLRLIFAESHLRAEEATPPVRAVAPKNDSDKALDVFNAFRLAVSQKDWAAAATYCMERVGERWVMPAATEALGDLLPTEFRDPFKKAAIYSVTGNSWTMALGIAVVGEKAPQKEQLIHFQCDGRGKPWFLVVAK